MKLHGQLQAAWVFIQDLHRDRVDRCMVATIGDTFTIRLNYSNSLESIKDVLTDIGREGTQKHIHTRLYDSIEEAIRTFPERDRRDRSRLVTIWTGGADDCSQWYPPKNPASPQMIGKYIYTRFNKEPFNRVALFAVGSAEKVNEKGLQTMAHFGGNFFTINRVNDFASLQPHLKSLAVNVINERRRVVINIDKASNLTLTSRPLDYCLLLDISGAMLDPA